MATEKQIVANRANAQKSRGPVTAEGRKTSSRNSTKHGLLSLTLVLDDESTERFKLLVKGLTAEFQPQTLSELALVESMAASRWRQMRAWGLERTALSATIRRMEEADPEFAAFDAPTKASLAFRDLIDNTNTLETLNRFEVRYDRQFNRCRNLLIKSREKTNFCDSNPI